MRCRSGTVSLKSCRRFEVSSVDSSVMPVRLPPGCDALVIRLVPIGSPAPHSTIGTFVVACRAASAAGPPAVTITSTLRRTSWAARLGS
jgi:hypothetical protein